MKETQVSTKMVKWLNEQPETYAFKYFAGSVYAVKGIPDILVIRKGKLIGLEVKIGNNKPTEVQLERHKEMRAAGADVYVVYSLDEVKEIFK